jgi:hypothetical protein
MPSAGNAPDRSKRTTDGPDARLGRKGRFRRRASRMMTHAGLFCNRSGDDRRIFGDEKRFGSSAPFMSTRRNQAPPDAILAATDLSRRQMDLTSFKSMIDHASGVKRGKSTSSRRWNQIDHFAQGAAPGRADPFLRLRRSGERPAPRDPGRTGPLKGTRRRTIHRHFG